MPTSTAKGIEKVAFMNSSKGFINYQITNDSMLEEKQRVKRLHVAFLLLSYKAGEWDIKHDIFRNVFVHFLLLHLLLHFLCFTCKNVVL